MSKRWEYKIIEGDTGGWKSSTTRKNTEEILNRLGQEGWECFGADFANNVYHLKREK